MRKIVFDKRGEPRFQANGMVAKLYEESAKRGFAMNELVGFSQDFSQEDIDEFYQAIGYSVGGYCELSLVSDESVNAAVEEVIRMGFPWQKGRKAVDDWMKANGYLK